MTATITSEFIRAEIAAQCYEISLHADDERLADSLTIAQIEYVLSNCKTIEQYLDDPRGESCLAVGFTPEATPVHAVCGKNRAGHLIIITVYIPAMPKWEDLFTRNR
ncbi:MAG: DUF4258 domain-containing protein [Candidatus Binatia bacterium]